MTAFYKVKVNILGKGAKYSVCIRLEMKCCTEYQCKDFKYGFYFLIVFLISVNYVDPSRPWICSHLSPCFQCVWRHITCVTNGSRSSQLAVVTIPMVVRNPGSIIAGEWVHKCCRPEASSFCPFTAPSLLAAILTFSTGHRHSPEIVCISNILF